MKIGKYLIHRKEQVDLRKTQKPIICIHKYYTNEKGELCCRRVFVKYWNKKRTKQGEKWETKYIMKRIHTIIA